VSDGAAHPDFWAIVVGFVSAVVSGVLIHIAKDLAAARRELGRKRRALWLACSNESLEAETDFKHLEWARDRVRELRGVGTSPVLGCVSAILARGLVDLDPVNIEVYQGIILSDELIRHRGQLAHADAERFVGLAPAERQPMVGLVDAQFLSTAEALLRFEDARLRALRVLRVSQADDERAATVIATAETRLRTLKEHCENWRAAYATRIGRTANDLRPE
jgi:hypothetical protein